MGEGLRILGWPHIMLPVAILAIGGPFGALHDHFRVKPLLILLLCFSMAGCALHLPAGRLSSSGGVGLVPDPRMTIGAGKASVNGAFILRLGHEKRDLSSAAILL